MLLDVLTGLPELPICTGYIVEGAETGDFPCRTTALAQARAVYESFQVWEEDIGHMRRLDDLPTAAIDCIRAVESAISKPVKFVSVGPERS